MILIDIWKELKSREILLLFFRLVIRCFKYNTFNIILLKKKLKWNTNLRTIMFRICDIKPDVLIFCAHYMKLAIACNKIASFCSFSTTRSCFYEGLSLGGGRKVSPRWQGGGYIQPKINKRAKALQKKPKTQMQVIIFIPKKQNSYYAPPLIAETSSIYMRDLISYWILALINSKHINAIL